MTSMTINNKAYHLQTAQWALGLAAFGWCYLDVLHWMYQRYVSPDSYYSHGFIIPFICAYLVYLKKDDIGKCAINYSGWGLALIAVAAFVHLMGTVFYIFSLSAFSIYILIFGASLLLFGKKTTSVVLFPLAFMIFMFPLPLAVIEALSIPLKSLVAKSSVGMIDLMGIPTFREGFNITIPGGHLLVGNPCSGLRSIIAFLAIGALLAYRANSSGLFKTLFFLAAIPVAVFCNVIRVISLILISHFWGLEAASPDTFWHSATGILMFLVGLAILFYISHLIDAKADN